MCLNDIYIQIDNLIYDASAMVSSNYNLVIDKFHIVFVLLSKTPKVLFDEIASADSLSSVQSQIEEVAKRFESCHISFVDSIIKKQPENSLKLLESEIQEVVCIRKGIKKHEENLCRAKLYSSLENYLGNSPKVQKYFGCTSTSNIIQGLSNSEKMSVKKYTTTTPPDVAIMKVQTVIDWVERSFPEYKREMQSVDWMKLHDKHNGAEIDVKKAEKEINKTLKSNKCGNLTQTYDYVIKSCKRVKI